ncbi:MAG: D-alanyl-D-alanine dipeptidase [Bacteroidetes bacterium]|nr:D-alanyl-D-alanine dipeptidase [Bacteroidota bacterium]
MRILTALLTILLWSCGSVRQPERSPSDIVDLRSIDPTFVLDIRYATEDNFTKKVLYPVAAAKLRRVAAESLASAQRELRSMGLGLKIFDGYRPLSIQWKLWEIVPDPDFVADPRKGSKHNRGAAVDLTIVDSLGNELEMPTGYDDFTERASHEYTALSEQVLANRALLLDVMTRHGFRPIKSEWWHYDFNGWEQFPLMDEPF